MIGKSAKAFVQDTAGYPLTVLLVLFATHRALSNAELLSWTQLTDKTLARHLDRLETHGYIQRNLTGWVLVSGLQLDLFADMPFILPVESEKFRLETPTTTTYFHEQSEGQRVEVVEASRKNSDSLNLLLELGVGRSMAEKLACLEWATVDYIQAHADRVNLPDDIGLFITRVRDGDKLPKVVVKKKDVQSRVDDFLKRR